MEAFGRLSDALRGNGVQVLDLSQHVTLEEQEVSGQLVNRLFTRDVGATLGSKVVLGSAGAQMRNPDFHFARRALQRLLDAEQISTAANQPGCSIEFGDLIILSPSAVLINVGYRTNRSAVEQLVPLLMEEGFEEIGLTTLPKEMNVPHLDVACNVVGGRWLLALSFARHMPVEVITPHAPPSYQMLPSFASRHGYQMIWVPPGHDPLGHINFISLAEDTILASTSGVLLPTLLRECGIDLRQIDIQALEQGCGGIRCLTLPLVRG
ncbi:MAG TPA: arginine deiminase family protein [Symbiobacteriaceae bacterium]|nr:arginine deiminase family protein [Symbiobacteriaceae bacterium]